MKRRRTIPTRDAFTLLETLASLVILSLVVIAGGRWLVSLATYSESLGSESSRALVAARTAELLRDDLFAAHAGSVRASTDEGAIAMTTSTQTPGDTPGTRGWREVRWSFDENEHAIERNSSPVNARADSRSRTVAAEADRWRLVRVTEEETNSGPAIYSLELSVRGSPVRRIVFEAIAEDRR